MSNEINGIRPSSSFGSLPRFHAEPKSQFNFASALSQAARFATGALGGTGLDLVSQQATLNELVEKQMAVQQMMLEVSFRSNVEKAKHDMEMAPVRNIRVS